MVILNTMISIKTSFIWNFLYLHIKKSILFFLLNFILHNSTSPSYPTAVDQKSQSILKTFHKSRKLAQRCPRKKFMRTELYFDFQIHILFLFTKQLFKIYRQFFHEYYLYNILLYRFSYAMASLPVYHRQIKIFNSAELSEWLNKLKGMIMWV